MIVYNPSDPTTEIVFNLFGVALEGRNLVNPGDSFILGEWVGLGVNETAVKISSNAFVVPAMIWTSTDRHDVTESEKVTVATGIFRVSTMNYKTGENFSVGDSVVVLTNNSIGKLLKFPGTTGTYYVVGTVRIVPANDGVDRLVVDIRPTVMTVVPS